MEGERTNQVHVFGEKWDILPGGFESFSFCVAKQVFFFFFFLIFWI